VTDDTFLIYALQRPNSFAIDDAMKKMNEAAAGSS